MSHNDRVRPLACLCACLAMLLLSSCSYINQLFGLSDGGDQNGGQTPLIENISTLIGNMARGLVSKLAITATEAATIADGATSAVHTIAAQLAGVDVSLPDTA